MLNRCLINYLYQKINALSEWGEISIDFYAQYSSQTEKACIPSLPTPILTALSHQTPVQTDVDYVHQTR